MVDSRLHNVGTLMADSLVYRLMAGKIDSGQREREIWYGYGVCGRRLDDWWWVVGGEKGGKRVTM